MKPLFLTAAAISAIILLLCMPPAAGNGTEHPEFVESVEIEVSPREARTLPGESAVFEYSLANGNDFYVFVKIIPDRIGAALEGWAVSVKITNPGGEFQVPAPFENGSIIRIGPGESEKVFLFVRPPDNAGNGSSLTTETLFLTLWLKQDLRMDGSYSSAGPVVTTVATGDSESEALPIVMAAATGLALAGLIYGIGTESGRFSLAGFVAPLYSRIRGEKVLDNDLRDSLYNYIRGNPGINFSSLMKEMELKNGTLSHHLRTLERERFIVSRREGAYRRFYPRGIRAEAATREILNPLQSEILAHVRSHAGFTQSLIASALDRSRQVVSYHIGILAEAGMIHVEKHGRKCFCYPVKNPAPNL